MYRTNLISFLKHTYSLALEDSPELVSSDQELNGWINGKIYAPTFYRVEKKQRTATKKNKPKRAV